MKQLYLTKADFYRFQVSVKLDKDFGNPNSMAVQTKVFMNFEFLETLLPWLQFYFKDPYRIIYMMTKAISDIGEEFVFSDYYYNDVAFKIQVFPLSGCKLPKTLKEVNLFIELLELEVKNFVDHVKSNSITKKLGESINTLLY